MGLSTTDIPAMVFRRVSVGDLDLLAEEGHPLVVLRALDSKKTLAEIGRDTGLRLKEIAQAIARLRSLKLVELVALDQDALRAIGRDFIQRLTGEYARAVGPIAIVLIEDTAREMGHSLDALPRYAAPELVARLAQAIQDAGREQAFVQAMAACSA